MHKMRIVFMGTPHFAKEILEDLIKENYNVVLTVSQPNKYVGRKRVLTKTLVKEVSDQYGITCLQPNNIKEITEEIKAVKPDLIITCAYGQFVNKEILEIPKYGAFNIHASLLPKLRGGAPIHKAIMYGHKESGISIIEMVSKMDAGDIIFQNKVKIENDETTKTLSEKLIPLGKVAIKEAIELIYKNSYTRVKQVESEVSFAYNISKEEEFVSFKREYNVVSNHIRSLIDKPVGYGVVNNLNIKLHEIKESDIVSEFEDGHILGLVEDGLGVVIENKVLIISKLQPSGKNVISGRDFVNGAGKKLIGEKFD